MNKYHLVFMVLVVVGTICDGFMFNPPKIPRQGSGSDPHRHNEQNNVLSEDRTRSSRGVVREEEFTREMGAACIMKYVDGLVKTTDSIKRVTYSWGPKDGCINVTEIQNAKDRYLKDWERGVSSLVKTNEQIMWDCDYDTLADSKDDTKNLYRGCINLEDIEYSVDTCIHGQEKLNMLNDKICKRASEMNPKPPVS